MRDSGSVVINDPFYLFFYLITQQNINQIDKKSQLEKLEGVTRL